ncbi:MAG: hypothetical protein HQL06_02580 [Nitrospirae bacterium]|nr:hypothetical protein [Nitrospirota bacterium]
MNGWLYDTIEELTVGCIRTTMTLRTQQAMKILDKELEVRTDKLEFAVKEKAKKDTELKEALRHAGLL